VIDLNEYADVLAQIDFGKLKEDKKAKEEIPMGQITEGLVNTQVKSEQFSPVEEIISRYKLVFMEGAMDFGEVLEGIVTAINDFMQKQVEAIETNYAKKISEAFPKVRL